MVRRLTMAELRMQQGFLVFTSQSHDGETIDLPLQPVNEDEAIIIGFGRGLGETIRVEKIDGQEFLMHTGSQMKRRTSIWKPNK